MAKPKEDIKKIVDRMIKDVSKNGGEYTFTAVKGEIRDIHYTKAK